MSVRQLFDLTGQVAVVTGGSRGLGLQIAEALGEMGAVLALTARRQDELDDAVRALAAQGITAVAFACDLARPDAVAPLVGQVMARFGRIDILVNNVGGSEPGDAVSMPEETWDQQIDFNLKTAFLGCKYAIPVMQEAGRGAIVNVASIVGLRNEPGGRELVGYSAAKAGLIQFSRSTAGAFARHGIRCNTVVPGLMHTPLVEHRLVRQSGSNAAEALIAKRNARPPLGRMGSGWDVAHAVLFLASDEAGYITGTELVVDGGLTTMMP